MIKIFPSETKPIEEWDFGLLEGFKLPDRYKTEQEIKGNLGTISSKQATEQSERQHKTNPWQVEEDKERHERFWYGE